MAESTPTNKHTFNGSCHCGFIKYTANIALPPAGEKVTASRCNCSVCHKSGFFSVSLDSSDDLHLLSPSSVSEVGDYIWRNPDIHQYFCPKCGIRVWGRGKYVLEGKEIPFCAISARTLDLDGLEGDLKETMDMRNWKIQYWDGKKDNWMAGGKEVPWEGGSI